MDTFPHFLVIENDEGVKKLLVPKKSMSSTIAAKSQMQTRKLLVYDIDEQFQPMSSNRENNLYLAYLSIVNKNYLKGLQLLRKYGNDIKKYSPEESMIFAMIKTTFEASKDHSPPACAVQLCAIAHVLKHIRLFGGDLYGFKDPNEFERYTTMLLDRYFSDSTESSRLTHDEEKEILQIFRKNKDSWIQARKQVIEGKKIDTVVVSQRTPSFSKKEEEKPTPERVIDSVKQKDFLDIKSTPVVLLPQKKTFLKKTKSLVEEPVEKEIEGEIKVKAKTPYEKFFTEEIVSEKILSDQNKKSLLQAISLSDNIHKYRFDALKDDIEIASKVNQKAVFIQVKDSDFTQLETRLIIECAEENKRQRCFFSPISTASKNSFSNSKTRRKS
jgi:hypothetical protein